MTNGRFTVLANSPMFAVEKELQFELATSGIES